MVLAKHLTWRSNGEGEVAVYGCSGGFCLVRERWGLWLYRESWYTVGKEVVNWWSTHVGNFLWTREGYKLLALSLQPWRQFATLGTVCNLGDSVQPRGRFANLVTVCNLRDSLQPWGQFATLETVCNLRDSVQPWGHVKPRIYNWTLDQTQTC